MCPWYLGYSYIETKGFRSPTHKKELFNLLNTLHCRCPTPLMKKLQQYGYFVFNCRASGIVDRSRIGLFCRDECRRRMVQGEFDVGSGSQVIVVVSLFCC